MIELAEDDRPASMADLMGEAPPTNVLVQPEDPVTLALAEVTTKNAKISDLIAHGRTLAATYKDVVADVKTIKGYDDIAGIRMKLRKEVRYPMQALQEEGSKLLGQMQRQFNKRAAELIAEAEGFEKPFHDMLTAEDERKESARQEREQKEAARKQGHLDAIGAINKMVTDAAGFNSEELRAQIEAAKNVIVDEGYEDFEPAALKAKVDTIQALEGMLVAVRGEELELEETRAAQARFAESQRLLAEQQADLKRQQDELAEGQRKLAEQQAEQQRAAQERADAIDRRIEVLRLHGAAFSHMAEPQNIQDCIDMMPSPDAITSDLYGDRVQYALTVRAEALEGLMQLHAKAVERVKQEREEAAAAAIQERLELVQGRIDNIKTIGSISELAPSGVLAQHEAWLSELSPTDDDYDDRTGEATALRDELLAQVRTRRIAAEKADMELAIQQQQQAAEVARRGRMLDNADNMFTLLADLVAATQALTAAKRAPIEALRDRAIAIIDTIEGTIS